MMLRMMAVVMLAALALVAPEARGGQERGVDLVEWDALEVDKLYMIRETVHAQASYRTQRLGLWRFDGGGVFKVHERLSHDGDLWYRMQWIKPDTIGDSEDILGWTKAEELRGHGVHELR